MSKSTHYTVIGAGHGGKAMAAHLALMGYPVTLYNRTFDHIAAIQQRKGIELESHDGGPHGFGKLVCVTSDMAEALAECDVVMIVVPSSAHADLARLAAPHLRNGQIVILHPGRTLGAIEFDKVLRDNGCAAEVIVAEAGTFIYASRSEGPAQARIFRIKQTVPVAALPAIRTSLVLETIEAAYPQFIDGVDVLHTSLNNMGAIFHPGLMLLNAGRVESTGGAFQFYMEGVTESVAEVLEVLDRERVTVASSLGIRALTGLEWLKMAYNASGRNLYRAIQNQHGYKGIMAPTSLEHRYITEDVPMSLVPIASLGQRYGVSVRGMDAIIRISCIMHHTDYWRRGRTTESLGIGKLSVGELTRYVREGIRN
jgi:opine dehydrogenase